jgi:hypothetical protein
MHVRQIERHRAGRTGWLRAAVLGANDGLLSTASLVLTAPELAVKLHIPVNWLYVQIRKRKLLVDRHTGGAYFFNDTAPVLDAVQRLRNHEIDHLDLRICQPHEKGHQHA